MRPSQPVKVDEPHGGQGDHKDVERLGHEADKSFDGRKRGRQGSFFNRQNLLKEMTSRRKMMRQSIWGVAIFYTVLLSLGSISFLVLSRLYDRVMETGRMHGSQQIVPYPGHSPVEPLVLNPPVNTFLGCSSEVLYNKTLVDIPVESQSQEHEVRISGGAFVLVTLTSSSNSEEQNVVYDIVLKGNSTNARLVSFRKEDPTLEHSTASHSVFNISTPPYTSPGANHLEDVLPSECVRLEMTVFVPPSLKKLRIVSEAIGHITFARDAHIDLEELSIDVSPAMTPSQPSILLHESVHAKQLALHLTEGWITGSISLVDKLFVKNERGRTELTVIPTASRNFDIPNPAILNTDTGGDMELTYRPNKAYRPRPIRSSHISRGGQMSLRYGPANFSGLLDLQYPNSSIPAIPLTGAAAGEPTHYFGQRDGLGSLQVRSSSRVTLTLLEKPEDAS